MTEKFLNKLTFTMSPTLWPRWARRIFVVTAPISFPLFVVWYVVVICGVMVCTFIIGVLYCFVVTAAFFKGLWKR